MKDFKSAFSGISTNDLQKAKDFYVNTLGFQPINEKMGLMIGLPGGAQLFIYEKDDHQPATFTVLNFVVENIDQTIDELNEKGIKFEQYDLGVAKTDERGVLRGKAANQGPDIAWFKDPAGNILSILED